MLAQARRTADRVHRELGEDARRLREDVGLSRRVIAEAAGVDHAFLGRIEEGRAHASLDTHARLAGALGASLGAHLYPNTGPALRDRHQARILEWLLTQLHSRWQPYLEVAVRQPARGWIDVVLHDPKDASVVAVEIQSQLRRLEQLIRWSAEKATALPSWEGFAQLGPVGTPSRLLLVRSTRATRQVGRDFARQLETAYPAHPADALSALAGTKPWPGPALIWVDLRPDAVRLLARR